MSPTQNNELVYVVSLLGAAVVAVPIFKRLGLGSVLGYLAAGLAIGPFGLGLFSDSGAILQVAELGVVMFLFVIGLEMQPSKLWNLRGQIFGLGLTQVVLCGALLTGAGVLYGFSPVVALIAAMGFVLSSTAIVMQILNERRETSTEAGQRVVSILLLEDLTIVPLLALVALLAPGRGASAHGAHWMPVGVALASIVVLVAAGRWVLNPLFRVLAKAKAREVMTAASLLVVLGSALLMQWGGLSMALGAFLAGVMLSESTFRHQLETDIEPFRGILLGLFFLGVGMSLDLAAVAREWPSILAIVLIFMLLKSAAVYTLARVLKAPHNEALTRAALLIQGGEFAFVLYSAAAAAGIFDARTSSILSASVIVSMALTPVVMLELRWFLDKRVPSMKGVEIARNLTGHALLIGFGRFGQIAGQALLARGFKLSIIEIDTDMIRDARGFGYMVFYGDGTRPDVLATAGAGTAQVIMVCVDDPDAIERIVRIAKSQFPDAQVLARAYDRPHALKLEHAGVDYQVRETLESALALGAEALRVLGLNGQETQDVIDDIRRRDSERFALQLVDGIHAGRELIQGNLAAYGLKRVPDPAEPTSRSA